MIRKFFKWVAILLLIVLIGVGFWGYAPDIPVKELRVKYANAESEFIRLDNGLTVHVRDEGPADAPAIILLHGSNASLHTWEQWTQKLKSEYRIIRFDQIGHGLTGPHPADDYSAKAFVETVSQVAKNRNLGKFYLGGNSMGGWVTHEYAKAHPEKLLGIILVDAGGAPDAKPKQLPIGFRIALTPGLNRIMQVITPRSVIENSLRQSVSNQSVVTEAEIDEYWELLRRPGNRAATAKRFASYRDPATAEPVSAQTRAVPALIVWGEEDKLIPVSSTKWFETTYKNSATRIYPRIGHLPMEEAAEASASDVKQWLKTAAVASKPH